MYWYKTFKFVCVAFITFVSYSSCTRESKFNKCFLDLTFHQEIEKYTNKCSSIPVCNNNYNSTIVFLPPYDYLFSIKSHILEKCCGMCINVTEKYTRHIHEDGELFASNKDSPDFAFPVLLKKSDRKWHGYNVLPIIRVPKLIYVTPLSQSNFERAVISCLHLYPLLTVCLLVALIFGFLIWIFETMANKKDFPRTFIEGWLKGIWWSTVTMASTGLERTPKSRISRVLAVLWIVAGVVMLGLITSSITAVIVKPVPTPKMTGQNVGLLQNMPYLEYLVLKNGGRYKAFAAKDISVEYRKMALSLYREEIDGVFVDEYMMNFASSYVSRNAHLKDEVSDFIFSKTVRTEIRSVEEMVYAVIIKDDDTYHYLQDAIRENWIHFENTFAQANSKIAKYEEQRQERIKRFTAPLFSPSDPYVYYAIACLGGILFVICCLGAMYELYRRKYLSVKKKTDDVPLTNGI